MLLLFYAAAILLVGNFSAHAEPVVEDELIVLDRREEVFIPDQEKCKENNTCDLKQVIFRTQSYRMPPVYATDIDLYGVVLYASYATDTLNKMEKYAFVQFIRGCAFVSQKTPEGDVVENFSVLREYMDTPQGLILFRHTRWMIDSNAPDPVYSSNPRFSKNRLFFLQWVSPAPQWIPEKQEKLYGEELPKSPEAFITDYPAPALLYVDGSARSVSLQFRTCLFKMADVPKRTSGSNINFATPITCFEWSDNRVYNHETKSWELPQGIVETCDRPLTAKEKRNERILRDWYKKPTNKKSK